MHRFFISPDWIDGDRITFEGAVVHQLTHVLRMQPEDRVIVLDDSGWEQEVVLTQVGPDRVEGQVVEKRLARGEPRTKISLYQSVLKGQRFELGLQKGTELGVVEFVPVISSRCIVSGLDDVNRKAERWQRIILEAAEQSGRGRLPRLRAALMFSRACGRAKRLGGLSLIPWEEENVTGLRQALHPTGDNEQRSAQPFSVNLFIGPEGGFTAEEIDVAKGYSIVPIGLGPRILRAETAGLATVSAIFCELGDMDCTPSKS
jgi:16S rRNA (uracil1498-N3)-methyltransferase